MKEKDKLEEMATQLTGIEPIKSEPTHIDAI